MYCLLSLSVRSFSWIQPNAHHHTPCKGVLSSGRRCLLSISTHMRPMLLLSRMAIGSRLQVNLLQGEARCTPHHYCCLMCLPSNTDCARSHLGEVLLHPLCLEAVNLADVAQHNACSPCRQHAHCQVCRLPACAHKPPMKPPVHDTACWTQLPSHTSLQAPLNVVQVHLPCLGNADQVLHAAKAPMHDRAVSTTQCAHTCHNQTLAPLGPHHHAWMEQGRLSCAP